MIANSYHGDGGRGRQSSRRSKNSEPVASPPIVSSFVDHRWTFANVSSAQSFYLTASRPNNSEGDDFEFQYSTDAGQNWTTLATVNAPGLTLYPVALGATISGSVIVRVIDTDPNTAGNSARDTVSIDQMYFATAPLAPLVLNSRQATASGGSQTVDPDFFQQTVNSAIDYWTAREPHSPATRLLSDTRFEMISISSSYLGLAYPDANRIHIDVDAAGFGWARVSLFDTLTHEIGHLYGHDHGELGEAVALLYPGLPVWTGSQATAGGLTNDVSGLMSTELSGLRRESISSPSLLGAGTPAFMPHRSSTHSSFDPDAVDALLAESEELLDELLSELSDKHILLLRARSH